MHKTLYFDSNATTRVMPQAIDAATQAMAELFGNPSSSHSKGLQAKAILNRARFYAAKVIGAKLEEVVFTSGATESIQTAMLSALCDIKERLEGREKTQALLVYGATEHKAVPQALAHWNCILGLNLEIRALPVNSQGRHDLEILSQWLPRTALLCTMAANNETGVVSDLEGVETILTASQSKALWLVDCVQALGKLTLNLQKTRIDYAAFSGHKLYAPKGVGMLYVRTGAPWTALMVGGGQETGLRSGTENIPGIAAFGAVLQLLADQKIFHTPETLKGFRDQLASSLCEAFPRIVFNTPLAHALPTTLNFSVPNVSSQMLLDIFDAAGVYVSAGSACSAGKAESSDVLVAMNLPQWQASSAVRLSFGPLVSADDIAAGCLAIARCGQLIEASHECALVNAETETLAEKNLEFSVDACALTLQWDELDDFLKKYPHAQLIDVRESFEHHASQGIQYGQRFAVNRPFSAMNESTREGIKVPAVVLFCRSGSRSLKAAQYLQSLGCGIVRHVHGGLAMRP
jgi:cysteine sulfinate desulfinase/cysteine desulfurase-like protein/rhodanese-related sulfurtransferase